MCSENRKKFYEGRDLWFEYTRLNGYSFTPSKEGLVKLSKQLDLNIHYIKERINLYLES